MNKKITLILVSFLFAISTAFSNNDTFFFENDIFTVVKNEIQNNLVGKSAIEGLAKDSSIKNYSAPVSTYYVKTVASGAGNGSTWADASSDLQGILNIAASGEQIWVAAGTYMPTQDYSGSNSPSNARTKTFKLKDGVGLYGGFVGTETVLSERNAATNETILSGDIGDSGDNTDNSYHVVIGNNLTNTAIFDGFTVQDGNANSGLSYNYDGHLFYATKGGGLFNFSSTYTISNISFRNNNGENGGAMMNSSSNITINDCKFISNTTTKEHSSGAIYGEGYASCTINRSVFDSNNGGGIAAFRGSYSVDRCVFVGNTNNGYGGAAYMRIGNLTVRNSVFVSNSSDGHGGAIYIVHENNESSANIYNSTFYNNTAIQSGNAIYGSGATIINSIFSNNTGSTSAINGTNSSNISYSLIDITDVFQATTSNLVAVTPAFINTSDLDGVDDIWGTADDGLMIGAGSSAFNAATTNQATATDIAGTSRPQFDTTDIGAYESTVTLQDTTDPEITTTALVATIDEGLTVLGTVSANEDVTWSITPNAGVQINQSGEVSLIAAATYGNIYTFTITATDTADNGATTDPISVTVNDITKPDARAQNFTAALGTDGTVTITGAQINNNSTDNSSGALTYTVSPDTFDCDDIAVSSSVAEPNGVQSKSGFSGAGYGEGYNPNTNEFWFASSGVREIRRYDFNTGELLGSFDSPVGYGMTLNNISQISIEKGNSDYYVANGSWNKIAKVSGDSIEWTFSMGNRASGITTDAQYVYASADIPGAYGSNIGTNTIKVIDKNTGLFVRDIVLPGNYASMGGLFYANDRLYLLGKAIDWSTSPNSFFAVHMIDAETGDYLGSFNNSFASNTPSRPYGHSFDGTTIWSSGGQGVLYGVKISDGNIYGDEKVVTLTVTDAAGNFSTATANVTVEDNIDPTITLNGDANITLRPGEAYTDAGASAADNCSEVTVVTTGTFDINTVGVYPFTYTAVDASGNESETITRTVSVINVAPSFTSTPITSINDNEQYSYTITTADGDGDIVHITASTIPAWLTLAGSSPTVSTFAGSTQGFTDGTGNAAKFGRTDGVGVDSDGNVYVADGGNHKIRKITSSGVVSTFAGSTQGYADGTGTDAKFNNPVRIALDADNNLYVTDNGNTKIRKITPAGVVTTLAGSSLGFADGPGASAKFNQLGGLDLDTAGNVYVADGNNNRIRKITPSGVVSTFAGSTSGFTDGTGTDAQFKIPYGIVVDAADNVFVAEAYNHAVRKITPAGVVSTVAGSGVFGFANGTGSEAQFRHAYDITIDAAGNLYVADVGNHMIRKVTQSGVVTTFAGSVAGFANGVGTDAKFNVPVDITIDAAGNFYVADTGNFKIRKLSSTGAVLTGNPSGHAGTHTVTLEGDDGFGGTAQQTFTITVTDNTKPVITLNTPIIQTIEVGSAYPELGATATDNHDDDSTLTVTIDDTNVNTSLVGDYTVTYNVSDAAGNVATTVTRTVNVVDTTKPAITLTGDNPQTIEVHTDYTELGVSATDNYDDTTTTITDFTITSTVNTAIIGDYVVTYNVTDANNNHAVQVTRTVKVVDTTKPVITLLGANPQIVDLNTAYVELGATAIDNYDENITVSIDDSAIDLTAVGSYVVTYTVSDSSGNTAVALTRTVFVLEPGKPWAKDNSFTVNQDSSNNIFNVLGNDSYGTDGPNADNSLSLSGTYTDNGGKLDLVGSTVQYTPRAGFSGVDNFSYTITDLTGDASVANVVVTVILNAKPTAVDDAIIIAKNSGATSINVIENDNFGADGSHPTEALTVSGASTEGGTTAVNTTTGEIAYTPALNFTGADSFTYTIKDTGGDTATATVLVTVTIVDIVTPVLRPTALPDAAAVSQNSGTTSINVLVNDSFGSKGAIADGLTMPDGTYTGASDRGGVISVNKNNIATTLDDEILYTPKAGFIGEDGFKYMITDTTGDTSITTVVVTVTQIATPTAVADAVTVAQDSGVTSIDVLANDSFGLNGAATSGSLVVLSGTITQGVTVAVVDNKINYKPAIGFSGADTFSYTITDGTGDVSAAVVTVTVSAAGTSNVPLAQDDAVTVTQNSVENLINVLDDNGSGADSYGSDGANASHPISLSGFYTDNGGELELNGNVVKYTPRTGFVGTDSFNYTLTDLNGDADTATVTITVEALPVVLTAVDDAYTVGQDSGATNFEVLDNDVLVGVTSITFTTVNGGVITLDDNGTDDFLIYTPNASYTGVDTFTYTISNGVDSSTGTVTVTVDSAAVIPGVLAAKADAFTVAQYITNTELNVLADNGSGADNYGAAGAKDGGLTLINGTLTGATEQGSVTIKDKGTPSPLDDRIEYTPNANYSGVDHFYYMITAVDGNTAIAQVTITVTPTALTTITAVDDALTVDFNSTNTSIDIFANDPGVRNLDNSANVNIEAIAFVFSNGGSIDQVDGGTLGSNNDDHFEYTPANTFSGDETVTYTITYNGGATTTATITFTVSPTTSVNGVPTAKNDAVSVLRNSVDHVINILNDNGSGADDFGTDGQSATHPISLSGTFTDIGSKIELDGNTVKYTPKTNFTGTDTFGYTITDANGDASSAIVTVNITVSKSSSETASSIEEVLQVYPNPSKGDLNVKVFSEKTELVSIVLFDVTGKVIYNKKEQLNIGKNIMNLNVHVKAGFLFLKVYSHSMDFGTEKILFK